MMFRYVLLVMLTAVAAAHADDAPALIQYDEPVKLGELANARIVESSGVATSRRSDQLYWTHNDSGHAAQLFAFDPNGADRATFTVTGVRNRDWEDIASFTYDGEPYLLVGDIGDNNQNNNHGTLLYIPEPRIDPKHPTRGHVRTRRAIQFTYEDGPGNCEALAVDPTTDTILLIRKVALGACGVYTLPLIDPADPQVARGQKAQRIGELWINMVTAADISPDGKRLIIGTYGPCYEIARAAGESWADAIQRKPRRIDAPRRRQGESLCYDHDGQSLILLSEKRPTPLWRIPAKTD